MTKNLILMTILAIPIMMNRRMLIVAILEIPETPEIQEIRGIREIQAIVGTQEILEILEILEIQETVGSYGLKFLPEVLIHVQLTLTVKLIVGEVIVLVSSEMEQIAIEFFRLKLIQRVC
ncbi:MAG TPA: hypothetical protein PL056_12445 [bacterium]|nr:hypothetical protein [bacterium]